MTGSVARHNTDITVDIQHADQRRRVEVSRVARWNRKPAQRYARLLESLNGGMAMLLSGRDIATARSARLSAQRRIVRRHVMSIDAVAEGCTRHLDQIHCGGGDLHLITRLPHGHRRPVDDPGRRSSDPLTCCMNNRA